MRDQCAVLHKYFPLSHISPYIKPVKSNKGDLHIVILPRVGILWSFSLQAANLSVTGYHHLPTSSHFSHFRKVKSRHPVVIFVVSSQSIGHRLSPKADVFTAINLNLTPLCLFMKYHIIVGIFGFLPFVLNLSSVIANSRRIHCHQSQS